MSVQHEACCPSLDLLKVGDVLVIAGFPHCTCVLSDVLDQCLVGKLLDLD